MKVSRLIDFYRTGALMLLNTLVVLLLLNIMLGIIFFAKDQISSRKDAGGLNSGRLFDESGKPLDNGQRYNYQLTWFDYTAYEQIVDEEYAGIVLDDFYHLSKLGVIYQPWVQFSESPYKGTLVHIDLDAKGFPVRRTMNPEKIENSVYSIFIFGGSTTFGYNVSDEHTWPSHLSKILNDYTKSNELQTQIKVINYGRGYYNMSQEMILLIDLVKAGQYPDLIIFMDGVNWGPEQDVPHYTKRLSKNLFNYQFTNNSFFSILNSWSWIPMIRLSNALKQKLKRNGNEDGYEIDKKEKTDDYVKNIINRFITNKQIIIRFCEFYGIKSLFFLQPDAAFNYPEDLYRLSLPESFLQSRGQRKQFYDNIKTVEGFIDFTDLFRLWGPGRKAIIDDVHYSPLFNRFLAEQVMEYIDLDSLAVRSEHPDVIKTTGAQRQLEFAKQ